MQEETYSTTAVELASWLQAVGFPVLRIEKDEDWFAFHFPPEAADAVALRWKGAEGGAARALFRSYRAVRGLIFQNGRRVGAP